MSNICMKVQICRGNNTVLHSVLHVHTLHQTHTMQTQTSREKCVAYVLLQKGEAAVINGLTQGSHSLYRVSQGVQIFSLAAELCIHHQEQVMSVYPSFPVVVVERL